MEPSYFDHNHRYATSNIMKKEASYSQLPLSKKLCHNANSMILCKCGH